MERFKSGLSNPCAMEELLSVIVAILRQNFTPQDCSNIIQQLTILLLRCKHKALLAVSVSFMRLYGFDNDAVRFIEMPPSDQRCCGKIKGCQFRDCSRYEATV